MNLLFGNNPQPIQNNPILTNFVLPLPPTPLPFPSIPPTLHESSCGPIRHHEESRPNVQKRRISSPTIVKVGRIRGKITEEYAEKRALLNNLLEQMSAPHLEVVRQNIKNMLEKDEQEHTMWMKQCDQAADAAACRQRWNVKDQETILTHLNYCLNNSPNDFNTTVKRCAQLYNKQEVTIYRHYKHFLKPSESPVQRKEVRSILKNVKKAYPNSASMFLQTSCQILSGANIDSK
uniref:Uncharacterized protein n=1 Tax=Caenorhabditis tropicalis TaxID=1561998 RepID=A0A1I7TR94_9PELO